MTKTIILLTVLFGAAAIAAFAAVRFFYLIRRETDDDYLWMRDQERSLREAEYDLNEAMDRAKPKRSKK